MSEIEKLNRPWLVAAWPGMGHVAVSAGYYLMSKLDMHFFAELSAESLFDVEHVAVKDGLIESVDLPKNRFFAWRDPDEHRDIVVFIGEAQPPSGKYAFCRRLVKFAQGLGVVQIFTFAAMATQMHPNHESRVFCAATNKSTLDQLQKLKLHILEDGHIGGLNGILLGAAAEAGLPGACLLGEMPHILTQLPYPKASLAVLRCFGSLSNMDVDLTELEQQTLALEEQLGELLANVERSLNRSPSEDESFESSSHDESISPRDRARLDELFDQAQADRSKAYELKRELDRLGVFADYEDRFLDLFKKSE